MLWPFLPGLNRSRRKGLAMARFFGLALEIHNLPELGEFR